jgi:AAA15 family ATPase/GTPase
MELTFSLSHTFTDPQSIKIDKVATLIGENGSGKSSVLHSIFTQKLSGKAYKDQKFICFSSGQNERFSGDFLNYLSKTKSSENNLQFSCFYFDKSWSRLLIFLATTLKSAGKARNFLVSSGYATEDEKVDTSTTLKISFRVDSQYVKQIQDALLREARGDINTIRQTAFHRSLESFIDECIEGKYDFEEPIKKNLFDLNQAALLKVSFDTEKHEDGETPVTFDPEIGFFIRAAHNSYFLDRETASLTLSNNLELSSLSDGEYQILFLYSLIDLFDDTKTIFILDEADSHLHYKNIEKFWTTLSAIKGKAISTTHLLDSIYCVGIDNIRVLNQGKVHLPSESKELLGRLSQLSNIKKSEFKALTYYKKIVLIDDLNDWLIFKELYKKLKSPFGLPNEHYEEIFDEVAVVKISSGWNTHNCNFAESKLLWVENFTKFCEGLDIKTKNIYLICDRDNLPLDGIGTDTSPLIVQGIRASSGKEIQTSILAWRRREVKHYLLSYTALGNCVPVINNHKLPEAAHLRRGYTGDYLLESYEGKYRAIIEKKSRSGKKTVTEIEQMAFNNYLATLPSEFIKTILSPFIENLEGEPYGLDQNLLLGYIANIDPNEVSEDIANMYNFIFGDF